MDENKYIKLFANCVPVAGAKRGIIYDLQRESFCVIPNGLYTLLTEEKLNTISEIKEKYEHKYDAIFDEYLEFLLKNEYCFICSKEQLKLFPEMDYKYEYPGVISNCIIDVNNQSEHNFSDIFCQLENLGCKDIQLRFYESIGLKQISEIINKIKDTRIKSIEIFIKHSENLTVTRLKSFAESNFRIISIYIHSAKINKIIKNIKSNNINIVYTKAKLEDNECGFINANYFALNLSFFSESKNYNSCLNKKVCIDKHGEIKNCPYSFKSYGNIKNVKLKDAIERAGFKDLWNIKKDDIEVCKDCEYRYMCSDCRIFIEEPDNIYSKPLHCNYDPFK